jgi:O-antigen/teichoic acid export membrane protein
MEFQQVLFRSVVWRGLYYVSQLLLNILIARYYEPAGSGWIFYTLNNYAFVLLVLSVSIDSGMGYFLAGKKINPGRLVTLSFAWTVISLVLSWFILLYYPYQPAEQRQLFYISSLAFIGGSMLVTFFSALFFAQKDFTTPNILLLAVNALVLLLFLGIKEDDTGFITRTNFLYLYILSFLLQGLLLAVFFRLKNSKGLSLQLPSSAEMKVLLHYSLLAFSGNMLTFLVFRSDYWFIDYFDRSSAELGNYIQVSKLAQLFFAVPSFLASAVFPVTAAGDGGSAGHLKTLSRWIALVSLIGCVLIGGTGKWLFPLGLDQMYLPFLLLIPGIISICLAYPLAAYFAGNNKIPVNIISSLLALVIIVAGNIIFIPLYGINGAAAVCSVGYAALFIYLLQKFRKENGSDLKEFFLLQSNDLRWLQRFYK